MNLSAAVADPPSGRSLASRLAKAVEGAPVRLREVLPAKAREHVSGQVARTVASFREAAKRQAGRRDAEQSAAVHRLLDRLDRAGVDVLLYGTRALVQTLSERGGVAPADAVGGPVRFLVRERDDDDRRVHFVLDGLGYARTAGADEYHDPKTGLVVSISMRGGAGLQALCAEGLWRHARKTRIGGAPVLVPSVTRQLVVHCLTELEPARTPAWFGALRPIDWQRLLADAKALGAHSDLCLALVNSGIEPSSLFLTSALLSQVEGAAGRAWARSPASTPTESRPRRLRDELREALELGRGEWLRQLRALPGSLLSELPEARDVARVAERWAKRWAPSETPVWARRTEKALGRITARARKFRSVVRAYSSHGQQ